MIDYWNDRIDEIQRFIDEIDLELRWLRIDVESLKDRTA